MLWNQVENLNAANRRQKRKRGTVRSYISEGGILTGAEGQQLAQEAEKLQEAREPKKRVPPRCSNCGIVG